ncbi:hypothetical protein IAU59_006882 [Kwoniella sp. CBS 9459]
MTSSSSSSITNPPPPSGIHPPTTYPIAGSLTLNTGSSFSSLTEAKPKPFVSKIRPPLARGSNLLPAPAQLPIKPQPRTSSLTSRPRPELPVSVPSLTSTSASGTGSGSRTKRVPVRSIPTLATASSSHRKAPTTTTTTTSSSVGSQRTISKRPSLRRAQNKVGVSASKGKMNNAMNMSSSNRSSTSESSSSSSSLIMEFPQPRVSFLTPREIWSPLATPIPGMDSISLGSTSLPGASTSGSETARAGAMPSTKVKMTPKTNIPKYQLRDPGVIPTSTSSGIPKASPRPTPKITSPNAKPRPTSLQPTTAGTSTHLVPPPKPRPVSQPAPSKVSTTQSLSTSSTITSADAEAQSFGPARRPPGIGTLIRNRAAASPPSQGEKLASLLSAHQGQPSRLSNPTTTTTTRIPHCTAEERTYSHSRHLSEPASTIEPFIDRPRPVSWNPAPTASFHTTASHMSCGSDEARLEAPLFDIRRGSNASIASSASNCSSASSLARHRAIRAKGRGRGRSSSSAKVGVLAQVEHSDREEPQGSVDMDMEFAESSLEGTLSFEDDETGSTMSDVSIRTAATVNQPSNVDHKAFQLAQSHDPPLPSPYEIIAPYDHSASTVKYEDDHEVVDGSYAYATSRETDSRGETSTSMCTPYLVPAAGPRMTLEWESDGEANGNGNGNSGCEAEIDEAEKVWRELEIKLGRKVRGRSLRRGRWVVRPVREDAREVASEESADYKSAAMDKTPSDFSISYYASRDTHANSGAGSALYDENEDMPSLSPVTSDPQAQATALFDMSAPLIPSASTSACTPWNTPALNNETLRRSRRVKKKASCGASVESTVAEGRSGRWVANQGQEQGFFGSCHEEELEGPGSDWPGESDNISSNNFMIESPTSSTSPSSPICYQGLTHFPQPYTNTLRHLQLQPEPQTQGRTQAELQGVAQKSPSPSLNHIIPPRPGPVYRLDSHVILALSALQGAFDSPELAHALAASCRSFTLDSIEDDVESSQRASDDDSDDVFETFQVRSGVEDDDMELSGGLGLGVSLKLDSIYHLPVLSPRLRPSYIARNSTIISTPPKLSSLERTAPTKTSSTMIDAEIRDSAGIVDSPVQMSVGGSHDIAVAGMAANSSQSDSKTTATDADANAEAGSKETVEEGPEDFIVEETIVIRDLDTGLAREVRLDSLVHDMSLQ